MAGNKQGRGVELVGEEIIEMVAGWIAQRWYKHQIKKQLEFMLEQPVAARTLERIMARARSLIKEGTVLSIEEHRLASIAFYTDIIRNPKCDVKHKIKCQERLDVLLRIEQAGEDNEGLAEKQAKVREMLKGIQDGEPSCTRSE